MLSELHLACALGSVDVVRALVGAKAFVDVKWYGRVSALQCCVFCFSALTFAAVKAKFRWT
jgi:hypothetical protein